MDAGLYVNRGAPGREWGAGARLAFTVDLLGFLVYLIIKPPSWFFRVFGKYQV